MTTNEKKLTPLLQVENKKPLDVGCGHVTASINPNGSVNSINGPHSKHGFITLTTLDQFSNNKWYESQYVRTYRRAMVETNSGFGVIPDMDLNWKISFLDGKDPVYEMTIDGIHVTSTFSARIDDGGSGAIVQQLTIENARESLGFFPVRIGGRFSLNRCSYGQLTEGGPIMVPEVKNDVSVRKNQISIKNDPLHARADIVIFEDGKPLLLEEMNIVESKPVEMEQIVKLKLEEKQKKVITVVYTLYEGLEQVTTRNVPMDYSSNDGSDQEIWSSFVIERNIEYILSCCSIPVSEEKVCIITDHQLLPLAWNRDAYYMMKLLFLSHEQNQDVRVQKVLKGHLLWMFHTANRPDGYWGRAYLTNGFCKDNIFQLDQQCYPLLELCEYFDAFGDVETVERCLPQVNEILEMLFRYKADEKWLFRTGETPADDKVNYPYHFSSQVLVWNTFSKLAKLNKCFSFSSSNLLEWANKVKLDCLDQFSASNNNKEMFAYLTDLENNYQFYHDANDLPTVLAPLWGFVSKENEKWINTMNFAFSQKNKGGYYEGGYEGLGSVHTPHKWPLGDGQELLYAFLMNDKKRVYRVLEKLQAAVQWDGLFSEAVDENTGVVASRHWFSWPGAFISYVLLLMGEG